VEPERPAFLYATILGLGLRLQPILGIPFQKKQQVAAANHQKDKAPSGYDLDFANTSLAYVAKAPMQARAINSEKMSFCVKAKSSPKINASTIRRQSAALIVERVSSASFRDSYT
jgi:hypothetical protein